MQQISIQIPDAQVAFMMELLQKFDFVIIDKPTDGKSITISNEQKELVELERNKGKSQPDSLLDWDSVKDTLKTA